MLSITNPVILWAILCSFWGTTSVISSLCSLCNKTSNQSSPRGIPFGYTHCFSWYLSIGCSCNHASGQKIVRVWHCRKVPPKLNFHSPTGTSMILELNSPHPTVKGRHQFIGSNRLLTSNSMFSMILLLTSRYHACSKGHQFWNSSLWAKWCGLYFS